MHLLKADRVAEGIFPHVEARNKFSKFVNRVAFGKERMVLARQGEEVAALVPMEDLSLLKELEERIDLDDAGKALKEPGAVSWEQVKKSLEL